MNFFQNPFYKFILFLILAACATGQSGKIKNLQPDVNFVRTIDNIIFNAEMKDNENSIIPIEVTALAEAREEARKNKEWDKADALRLEIEQRGYEIKDGSGGKFVINKVTK